MSRYDDQDPWSFPERESLPDIPPIHRMFQIGVIAVGIVIAAILYGLWRHFS